MSLIPTILRPIVGIKRRSLLASVGWTTFDCPKVAKRRQKSNKKEILRAHIALAKKYQKPLILHIREASDDTQAILIEENANEVGGVLHCFNGDECLLELVEHNFYFGIGGIITFKNAKKLVEILPKIPLDRLVVETDAPYLTPHPHRGKRNDSSYIPIIIDKMSEILQIDRATLQRHLRDNSRRLFPQMG